jgi:hypothetical protein
MHDATDSDCISDAPHDDFDNDDRNHSCRVNVRPVTESWNLEL